MTDPVTIQRVLYVSRESWPMSVRELERIAETSQASNVLADMSGALIYARGSFVQILEGPVAVVHATLARIATDPRHRDLHIMLSQRDQPRQFDRWSMACFRSEEPVQVAGKATGQVAIDVLALMLKLYRERDIAEGAPVFAPA